MATHTQTHTHVLYKTEVIYKNLHTHTRARNTKLRHNGIQQQQQHHTQHKNILVMCCRCTKIFETTKKKTPNRMN